MEDKLKKINNELKVYLNEAKFVSNKCRNKVIKLLIDSLDCNVESSNYVEFAYVDVLITNEFKLNIRGRDYELNKSIKDIDELEERYNIFKEKVDKFMSNKKLTFDNKNNFGQMLNLVMVGLIILLVIAVTIVAIKAILRGDYSFGLWFVIYIIPATVPRLRDNLFIRVNQAKVYLKRLMKKRK